VQSTPNGEFWLRVLAGDRSHDPSSRRRIHGTTFACYSSVAGYPIRDQVVTEEAAMAGQPSTSALAWEKLRVALTSALDDPTVAGELRLSAKRSLQKARRNQIDEIFDLRPSYREALAIQIAYRIADETVDLRHRQGGGRGVAQKFAVLLAASHIAATKDAFQNIGKNNTNLVRGNAAAFDDLLTWGSRADRSEIQPIFDYVITGLALLSRPVLEMPDLDHGKLTFFNTGRFIEVSVRRATRPFALTRWQLVLRPSSTAVARRSC
jgi:hypothetical protein